MSHDTRSGSSVRESTPDRVGARTARTAVWRLAVHLLGAGLVCLAVGLPNLARLAARGSVSALHAGVLAVGYACLALAAAVPAVYWALVLSVGVGTLLARGALAAWRRARTVHAEQVVDPGGRLRL